MSSPNSNAGRKSSIGRRKMKFHKKESPEGGAGGDKDKLRIKLPPIEAYDKKMVFDINEAPGRIVSRLERLMGTDHVKLLDLNWMKQLEIRLNEEDERAWEIRNEKRLKGEETRHRKLIIGGLLPVTKGMEDIERDPVYRVNQIMRRLNKLDPGAILTTPPKGRKPHLTLMEPFEFDKSGRIFKDFPGHQRFGNALEDMDSPKMADATSETTSSLLTLFEGVGHNNIGTQTKMNRATPQVSRSPSVSITRRGSGNSSGTGTGSRRNTLLASPKLKELFAEFDLPPKGEDGNEEEEEEEEGDDEELGVSKWEEEEEEEGDEEPMLSKSLFSLQKYYGIDESVDLQKWKPFEDLPVEAFDELLDELDQAKLAEGLFRLASQVLLLEEKELEDSNKEFQEKMDEYLDSHKEPPREPPPTRKSIGGPSSRKSKSSHSPDAESLKQPEPEPSSAVDVTTTDLQNVTSSSLGVVHDDPSKIMNNGEEEEEDG